MESEQRQGLHAWFAVGITVQKICTPTQIVMNCQAPAASDVASQFTTNDQPNPLPVRLRCVYFE